MLLCRAFLGHTSLQQKFRCCRVRAAERPSNCDATALVEDSAAKNQQTCPPSEAIPPNSAYPFWFGTATSAYQIEGGWNQDGRGPSIWDTFTQAGKAKGGATGNVAIDFYNRYPEDIKLLQSLGVRNFRLSIAWPRILPNGRGAVNQAGLDFYSRVIDALLAACITPHVTLYHWDLPQALHDEYKGWLDPKVQDDFAEYATVVFKALGSKVKYWTTFNEPYTFCFIGYGIGAHAPGRCTNCPEGGNSVTEPLIAARNVVLAHAKAVAKFRDLVPQGQISMNLNLDWAQPRDPTSAEDKAAAERFLDYMLHVYADPLYTGDIPAWLREAVPEVPRFSDTDKQLLSAAGPLDYFALNHYTTSYTFNEPGYLPTRVGTTKTGLDGKLIGPIADSEWLSVNPVGIRKVLNHVNDRYKPSTIIVTENGVDAPGETSLDAAKNDEFRRSFFEGYLANVKAAVEEDRVPVKGYFAWSAFDNLEWAEGFSKRFGIVFVDYEKNLTRTPKNSAYWLAKQFGLQNCKSSPSFPPSIAPSLAPSPSSNLAAASTLATKGILHLVVLTAWCLAAWW